MNPIIIFDFNTLSNISKWVIVDDVVMGGKSNGTFKLDIDGNGVFEGNISLENNGGFSLLKYQFKKIAVLNYKQIKLRIKGDGKRYQFRVKSNQNNQHSYISFFNTTTNWQTVTIELADLIPYYRGKKLNLPYFPCKELDEIGILLGNNKNEDFKLKIDSIVLV